MSAEFYVVKAGDTLGKIAEAHNTSVLDLVKSNQIANPDRIRVGQQIKLPRPVLVAAHERVPPRSEEGWGALVLQFVDALGAPIRELKVSLEALGKILQVSTNEKGAVEPIAVRKGDSVKVHVERARGGVKHVATVEADGAAQLVRIRSPKVAVRAALRPHDGPSGPTPTVQPRALGEETGTRSPAGNPVQEVALECPNPENIRLDSNFKYRSFVIAAAKRANLAPQAVAAIMNAEAGSIARRYIEKTVIDFATGQPKTGKDGKPEVVRILDPQWLEGEWDPRSINKKSSARGMTQVLDGTWIDLACVEGTFLNAKAQQAGWLGKTTVWITRNGKVNARTVDGYRLADGKLVTQSAKTSLAGVLSRKPYLVGYATAADANLQALLDLRFDPECAIHTAVDYGMRNLAILRRAGYQVDGHNDGDLAKLIYLCHHLGVGDAMRFIDNRITPTRAQYLFEQQVGVRGAKEEAEKCGGNYLAAHRKWLDWFVNKKIVVSGFYCVVQTQAVRTLFAVCEAVRKKG